MKETQDYVTGRRYRRQDVNFALATGFIVVAAQNSVELEFASLESPNLFKIIAFATALFWGIKKYYQYDNSFYENKSRVARFIDLFFLVLFYGVLIHLVGEVNDEISVGWHLVIAFGGLTLWNICIVLAMLFQSVPEDRVAAEGHVPPYTQIHTKRRIIFGVSSAILAFAGLLIALGSVDPLICIIVILIWSVLEAYVGQTFLGRDNHE